MNKLAATFAVGFAAFTTALIPSKEVSAALTPPASYDYSYEWNGVGAFALNTKTIYYTRTADSSYFNYTVTEEVTEGLDVTMTFNRSNTNWTHITGGPNAGKYYPSETKIGSDDTVGNVVKFTLIYDNQTNRDYKLTLDTSSSANYNFRIIYNDGLTSVLTTNSVSANLREYFIPSYTKVEYQLVGTSAARYFDAWYLQDLGVSEAYQAGVDAGEIIGYDDGYADGLGNNPNVLLNGFETVIGIFVNFVLMIATFDIFGVSIMNILLVFVTVIGLVWILKVLRG